MSHSNELPQELQQQLDLLEKKRQDIIIKAKKRRSTAFAVAAIGGLIGLVIHPIATVVIILITLIVSSSITGNKKRVYCQLYKDVVGKQVIKTIDDNLEFHPNRGIDINTFRESKLFRHGIDRYKSEDLCDGTYEKTRISFSELHAEYKSTSTDSKGRRRTSWHTIFKGLYLVADFNKDFQSWVTVAPDVAEKSFGFIGRSMQKLGGNLLRLESPEFEKHFVIRGSDSVEARYILTPDMQERILDLSKRFGEHIRLAFRNSKVYCAIPSRENLFEPSFDRPANDLNSINKLRDELKLFLDIVEHLDLNTRIWTKE